MATEKVIANHDNGKGESFPLRLEQTVSQAVFLFEAADAFFSSGNALTTDAQRGFFHLYNGVVERLADCVAMAGSMNTQGGEND